MSTVLIRPTIARGDKKGFIKDLNYKPFDLSKSLKLITRNCHFCYNKNSYYENLYPEVRVPKLAENHFIIVSDEMYKQHLYKLMR